MPLEVPGSPAGRALPRACSAALALCQERSKIRTSGLCLSGRMGVDGKVQWRMSTQHLTLRRRRSRRAPRWPARQTHPRV